MLVVLSKIVLDGLRKGHLTSSSQLLNLRYDFVPISFPACSQSFPLAILQRQVNHFSFSVIQKGTGLDGQYKCHKISTETCIHCLRTSLRMCLFNFLRPASIYVHIYIYLRQIYLSQKLAHECRYDHRLQENVFQCEMNVSPFSLHTLVPFSDAKFGLFFISDLTCMGKQ